MKKLYELTDLSPREAMDLYPGPDLPIRGGWGYDAEDACIIDKNDPIVDQDSPIPFYGTGYEKIFVEQRIYLELVTLPKAEDKYSGIEWNMVQQKLIHHNEKPHDILEYRVTGYKDSDWRLLKEEWEGSDGIRNPDFDKENHLQKRDKLKQTIEMEFWFEISSFFKQIF